MYIRQPKQLKLISYLAPNMFWFYKAVAEYLGRVFDIETPIIQSQYDPLADPALLENKLDIAFICGLPFIRYHQIIPNQLKAIVAPVMQSQRYQNGPVYFADIIVNANSKVKNFDDLAGKTLCYNDSGSNSGYNLLRHRLMQANYSSSFFGRVISSGSHQRSIRWVADGVADCSAIDSTVLEQELRDFPQLCHQLRVIDSVGPCPMPPVVVAQRLGTFIDEVQSALLQPDTQLQLAMHQAQIKCYAAVRSQDYNEIANIYDTTVKAGYELLQSSH